MAVSETIQRYITNLDFSRDFLAQYLSGKGVNGVSENDKIDRLVRRLPEITTALINTGTCTYIVPNYTVAMSVTVNFALMCSITVYKNVTAGTATAVPLMTVENDPIIMGDANADGKVTSADSELALSIASHLITPTAYQLLVCDVDGDGSVTGNDSYIIARAADYLEQINQRTAIGFTTGCLVRAGNT